MAFQDWQNQAFQGSYKREIWVEVSSNLHNLEQEFANITIATQHKFMWKQVSFILPR